mmetsp:Transcript_75332/g.194213  ORF Transcript_75332/g.194213 Transcript_75332/m.194213 type:complete len:208 (+) Transcript_75332:88-711(+)
MSIICLYSPQIISSSPFSICRETLLMTLLATPVVLHSLSRFTTIFPSTVRMKTCSAVSVFRSCIVMRLARASSPTSQRSASEFGSWPATDISAYVFQFTTSQRWIRARPCTDALPSQAAPAISWICFCSSCSATTRAPAPLPAGSTPFRNTLNTVRQRLVGSYCVTNSPNFSPPPSSSLMPRRAEPDRLILPGLPSAVSWLLLSSFT